MTKCGRYGATKAHFDYRPDTIRRSVERSLARLHTDYLDTVYLHDVEFVCSQVQPRQEGNHMHALDTENVEYGLDPGQEGKVWGEGDQILLDAVAELRKMKAEGLIKNVGITGKCAGAPQINRDLPFTIYHTHTTRLSPPHAPPPRHPRSEHSPVRAA